ncbi:MAG: hypothetical protein VSS75_028460 [Candidatus Parabeggiatoa sp.]|nr:hypothetical protein [Candidatus Parabeggiatoa sp.]
MWIKTIKQACPTVCQDTDYNKPYQQVLTQGLLRRVPVSKRIMFALPILPDSECALI